MAEFKQSSSLKATIVIPLALLFVATALTVLVFVYRYLNAQRIDEAKNRSEVIAYAIQYTAEIAGDSPELSRMVQALGTEKDIELIKVVSLKSQRIVASNRFGWRNKFYRNIEPNRVHSRFLQAFSEGRSVDIAELQVNNKTFTYASVFFVDSEVNRGKLEKAVVIVDFDTSKALSAIWMKIAYLALMLLLSVVALITLVYLLLKHMLYRPIDNIATTIRERTSRHKSSMANIYRHDEIGLLAMTLNNFIVEEEKSIQTLEDREQELQLIFDNVPVRIWYKDDKNTILRLNKYAAESMGMQVAAVEGQNTSDLFPEMAEKYLQDDLAVILSGSPKLNIVERYTPSDAEHGWVRTDKVPYEFADGSKKGVLVVAQDITALKNAEHKLRESEQRFKLAMEATRDGVWDWPDMSQDEEYWSPQWKALLGYEPDEIEAKASTFFSMLHPDDRKGMEDAVKDHMESNIPFDVEYRLKTKNGTYKWFRAKGIISNHPRTGKQRMTGSITDIQEQKDAQAKLLEYNAELERSNRDLDEFAYIASHDLKSPLRGIDQLANWIEEDLAAGRCDETKSNLALMRGRVKRLEKLLSDLLTYSRVGRNKEKFGNVNVDELAQDIFSFSPQSDSLRLELTGNLPTFLTLSAPFEQVLRNLISNAIKHHNNINGKIIVGCEPHEDEAMYSFFVRDDGPGIDERYHDLIFKMFKSLKPRDEVEGSGMGLALIRKIVHTYGGEVSLSSKPGEGSTFYFTWPKSIVTSE